MKVFEGNLKNVCQKAITTNSPFAIHQIFKCFVITLLKWMKYKNRLTFAYYSITFWDIKNLQSVPKIWKVLKSKNKFFKKMFKYRNTVCYDFKSRFLVIFSRNYRHHLVLKIPFPDHIFPKISKYRTENLHFPSTGKYYAPPHPPPTLTPTPYIINYVINWILRRNSKKI